MNIEYNKNNFDIGVVGAGSWGTAIANLLAKKGNKVDLWALEPDVVKNINIFRENKKFLPGIKLSKNIYSSNSLKDVVINNKIIILVIPSHFFREVFIKISSFINSDTIVISASKGIEDLTYMTMSNIIKSILPDISNKKLAVLTGPSFAIEVAKQIPTAVTLATFSNDLGKFLQNLFTTESFRVYTNSDIIGVEVGASIKNVIAIASGVVEGLGLGLNTRAALITRGLSEIIRLGVALGANTQTFSGLSGIGDLILTCTGKSSRNYTVGKLIASGKILKDILEEMYMVVEGVRTAKSVYNLSNNLSIEMPISCAVYKLLYENLDPLIAVNNLMMRPMKCELD